jgi:hypothetical protein
MTKHRIRILEKAKEDFVILSKKSKYRARIYKTIDILIKIIISVGGAIITYFSDPKEENMNMLNLLRALGITITVMTAFSSLFTFEKRSLSHIQIHTKCQNIIPEIEDKIENKDTQGVRDYIKNIYKELSILSIASFTDSLSQRNIKTEE